MVMKKYVVALLCLLVAVSFIAPAFATSTSGGSNYSAYSVDELEALISKLQKQLEEMKKGSQCFVSDKDLSLGDGDEDGLSEEVRRLQNFLREKGYFFAKKSTGYFGKITRTALVNFQKGTGIAQTGEFDATTRAKAHSLYCKTTRSENKTEKKEIIKSEEKKEVKQEVKSGVNSLSLSVQGNAITWKTDGYSKNGFKIVWSKTGGPTYPTREGDKYIYLSGPETNSVTLNAFDGAGTYYARVCEYLGGACGTYSNEVAVSL